MTIETPPAVPQYVAERFAKAYAAFVDAVRKAINENIGNPALANAPAFLVWQTQALPRLEQENASVQKAMAMFLIGDTRSIPQAASEARGLAKKLDGFSLDFAGPEHSQTLDKLETSIVMAAYQVCAAAGIP